jgi:hypothetical protein
MLNLIPQNKKNIRLPKDKFHRSVYNCNTYCMVSDGGKQKYLFSSSKYLNTKERYKTILVYEKLVLSDGAYCQQ